MYEFKEDVSIVVETEDVDLCLEFIGIYVCATTMKLLWTNLKHPRFDESCKIWQNPHQNNTNPRFEILSFSSFFILLHSWTCCNSNKRDNGGAILLHVWGGGDVFGSFVVVNNLFDAIAVLWHWIWLIAFWLLFLL